MNKTAIKNFAVWARNKLIADISYKAVLLGITEREIKSPLSQSTKDAQFFDIGSRDPYQITGAAIVQRKALADRINERARQSDYATAYKTVIEEVAYTWFNRLVAVRFMEANDYLPSRVRVLSGTDGKQEPDIVTSPFDTDLEFSQAEREYIIACKTNNKLDELFRMLFIKQCNALNAILPELFERIGDYTELLLNISFTDKDGMLWHLINDVAEADFTEAVEIIGWMYQYYNIEPKDETFALLKKNVKITKERIPAATQLFTPDWIVRYMVENSLGRLWLEGHPNDALKANWKYYLDEAEQTPEVQVQLDKIRTERRGLSPEDITFIDPCMGSGHILVYAFEVFMQIYESAGYAQRDAAKLILEENLHGLDIDKRAYQLAYFALMMKARQYNRRIFAENVKPQVYHPAGFADGEEYGSLLKIDDPGERPKEQSGQLNLFDEKHDIALRIWNFKRVLARKYDVVCTNPPYAGGRNINPQLLDFLSREFTDSKSDLFSSFIERCSDFTESNGICAMITMHSWMFLSSYEKLRSKLLMHDIVNMVHLGPRAFAEIGGEVVQTTAFILNNLKTMGYLGMYVRLVDFSSQNEKETEFLNGDHRYTADSANFVKIPGEPIAYWISKQMLKCFDNKLLGAFGEPKQGFATGDNSRFLRLWQEISFVDVGIGLATMQEAKESKYRWFPCNKGGTYRKWYGNNEIVANWKDGGVEMSAFSGSVIRNPNYYFREGLTWSSLANDLSMRYSPKGFLFESKGSVCFVNDKKYKLYLLGLLNSKQISNILLVLSPTLDFHEGPMSRVPIAVDDNKFNTINDIVNSNISLSRTDWNSFEASWDFKKHPLLQVKINTWWGDEEDNPRQYKIEDSFRLWKDITDAQFATLKANEEELNRIFIDIYGLQDELTPEVEDKDVTVRRADAERDMRSLISYAVGCMFGRYSLDVEGLAYAGGEWDADKYRNFMPDADNILPITDEEYLSDDVVTRFVEFIRTVYGADTLEENLRFIASALGGKGGSAREVIRSYFLKDFYKDHVKIYQKRPIYWLFDSGKADGFKALVYLHRYNQDTVGKLRIDYLHRLQRVYESEIGRMRETMEKSTDSREISAAQKRMEKLTKQMKEAKEYDEKIAHLALARIALDLDDGVKVNYEKLQTGTDGKKYEVLGKI